MNQKTALYISLTITAFVLIALGSVALAWPALQGSQAGDSLTAQTPPEAQFAVSSSQDASADPQTLLATAQARDAAYRSQIEQANQQLNNAYQQLQELKAQNQLLLEREQIYQQRLQESAQIIEAMSAQSSASMTVASSEEHEGERHDDND